LSAIGLTASFGYDNNGNTTSRSTTLNGSTTSESFTYDGFGRMTSYASSGSSSVSYSYDHEGLRNAKTVGTTQTKYLWAGSNLVCATVGSTGTYYIYGTSLAMMIGPDGTLYTYQFNPHGDVTAVINMTTGQAVESYSYDPYGNVTTTTHVTGGIDNPFLYCGEYYDEESGLYYLRARYYDPELGRFLTEDPIHDGINWYVYANNNPLMYLDRFGLAAVSIRDYTTGYGGAVNWDDTVGVASFIINDNSFWATGSGYNRVGITITNIDGRLYAEDSELNNYFFGVTPDDMQAGVTITMFDGVPYIDISTPVLNALKRDVGDFEAKKGKNIYFASRVGNDGDWNLKYREDDGNHWEETLGISFWGYQTQMLLNGKLVIVEQVGNITYGYLGAAAGMSEVWMNIGSSVNHFFKHGFFDWDNERADQSLFKLGINWYNTGVMQ